MVDVDVKNDLVRVHVVDLKDVCESVVMRVEALVAPVGIDRSSHGRESATRAVDTARLGVRSGGTNSSAKAEVSRHVCHNNEGIGGCKPKSRRRGRKHVGHENGRT
jgi:hypothetical protein